MVAHLAQAASLRTPATQLPSAPGDGMELCSLDLLEVPGICLLTEEL